MFSFEDARVTIAEAAFVSGVSSKEINREIDARVISATGEERRLRGPDLVYLAAVKDLKNHFDPSLRRKLRKAIASAVTSREPFARYSMLMFPVAELRENVLSGFAELERLIGDHIEQRPDVLGGEPVIRGTRIAARHIADLSRQGASNEELQDDLDLSASAVRAALAYSQTHPRRGRPRTGRHRTVHVSPAR